MTAIIMKDLDVVVVVFCIVVVVVLLIFLCDGDSEMVVTSYADLSILPFLTSLSRALTTRFVHRSRYLSTLD